MAKTRRTKGKPGGAKQGANGARVGRPSPYQEDFPQRAFAEACKGSTDLELAAHFGVNVDTVYTWKKKHPEFSEAVKAGKAMVDQKVEKSLLMRALGMTVPAVKIFNDQGEPMVIPYQEHLPPDVGACLNWLKNRQPERWRDRQEITGPNGGPVQIQKLSDGELEAIAIAGRSGGG